MKASEFLFENLKPGNFTVDDQGLCDILNNISADLGNQVIDYISNIGEFDQIVEEEQDKAIYIVEDFIESIIGADLYHASMLLGDVYINGSDREWQGAIKQRTLHES